MMVCSNFAKILRGFSQPQQVWVVSALFPRRCSFVLVCYVYVAVE